MTITSTNKDSLASLIERDGFAVTQTTLDDAALVTLTNAFDEALVTAYASDRTRAGARLSLTTDHTLATFIKDDLVSAAITNTVGSRAFIVRALLFDKSGAANWMVPWHRDVTICVKAQHNVEGFGPWSVKAGKPHVRPPVQVLRNMLTVRLHLDATDATNGALRVIPCTHHVADSWSDIKDRLPEQGEDVLCAARRGDVLFFKPLILHASDRAIQPTRRRIIHLELASAPLASPLRWNTTLQN